MKKTAIFILLILTASVGFARIIPYVSPGITLGYNFNNKCFSFIPKVSLGISNWGDIPHFYTNITLGWNLLTRRTPEFNHSNYLFAEIQGGSYFFGGGFGYAFAKIRGENRWKKYRKYSVSIGSFLYYLNAHGVKTENGTNSTLGLQAILPIPLVYVDIL